MENKSFYLIIFYIIIIKVLNNQKFLLINKSICLIDSNKEKIKNLNKVTKSLFPLKKQINNPKFQNNRYINKNSNNFKIIKNNSNNYI